MADNKKTVSKPKQPAKSGVFDIHPGKVPANATSRPLIIKHPVMTDPMVNTDPEPVSDVPSAPVLQPAKRQVIQPLHDLSDVAEEAKPAAEVPVTEVAPEKSVEFVAQPIAEEAQAPVTSPEAPIETPTEASAKAPVATPVEAPGAPSQPTEKSELKPELPTPKEKPVAAPQASIDALPEDDQAVAERELRLQKMVESEEYFLPIETIEQRRSRKFAIIGVLVIILLAAAWYDVALDSVLLPNTYHLPHTALFSVK